MSHENNVNVLETAQELIDLLDGSEMAQKLQTYIDSNDLEAVYHTNKAILAALAADVMLSQCCNAPIIENTDFCSECKEHTGAEI